MNVLANKYSFHPLMKEKIPVATSPGTVSGKITVAKILNLPAPSTLAASSREIGIVSKNPFIIHVQNGIENVQ